MTDPPQPACRHCGGERRWLFSSEVEDDHVSLYRCGCCRLVTAGNTAKDADYDYYQDRLDWSDDDLYLALNTKRLRTRLDALAAMAPGRRLLDVGCGEGQLLRTAREMGWEGRGIELSEPAVAICRARGLPVTRTDFFSADLRPGSADVVVMSELIEHVPNPGAFLRRAEELLVPGGLVYLTTPNFASLGRRVLQASWGAVGSEHVSYFTPTTLRKVVRDSTGLAIRAVGTRNLSAAALRRLVPLHLVGRSPADPGAKAAPQPAIVSISDAYQREQALRHRVENSPLLRTGRTALNAVLDLFGLGEQMEAVLVKRG